MTCKCGKFAHDPECTRPEHSAQTLSVSSPAFYEERIRRLTEERDRLRDALREAAAALGDAADRLNDAGRYASGSIAHNARVNAEDDAALGGVDE